MAQHGRLPQRREEHEGIALGSWASKQRTAHTNGELQPERAAALEGVPGWTWDPVGQAWEEHLEGLRAFVAWQRLGVCLIMGCGRMGCWEGGCTRSGRRVKRAGWHLSGGQKGTELEALAQRSEVAVDGTCRQHLCYEGVTPRYQAYLG